MADTRTMADTVKATPVTRVATIVTRTRTVRSRAMALRSIGQHPVADVAHGLDRVQPEGDIDLLAQVAHVHLDDVGIAAELMAPYLVEDLPFRDHPTVAPQQRRQHTELARCELHLYAVAVAGVGEWIEHECAGAEDGGPRRASPA